LSSSLSQSLAVMKFAEFVLQDGAKRTMKDDAQTPYFPNSSF